MRRSVEQIALILVNERARCFQLLTIVLLLVSVVLAMDESGFGQILLGVLYSCYVHNYGVFGSIRVHNVVHFVSVFLHFMPIDIQEVLDATYLSSGGMEGIYLEHSVGDIIGVIVALLNS